MMWNRWAARVLVGLLAIPVFGGCKQQTFLEPGDYADAVNSNLPKALARDPHSIIVPPLVDPKMKPADVLDPNRPARYVTLKECIAIALEQGNDGGGNAPFQNGGVPAFKSEILPSFNPGQSFPSNVGQTDAVRAFAITPAEVEANIERSLSKFDARWITSMQWQKVDQPVAAQFLNFQQQRDVASISTTLAKPLPTGGVAGITMSVDYSKFGQIPASQQASFVNPNYTPRLQFTFDQPLLQLFGVEVNQLTSTAPQSLIQNIRASGGQGVEGILLTRIRYDQSRTDFERRINFLLVNVELAYWNLYASYYNLYAQEDALRGAFNQWRFIRALVVAGSATPQSLNQARAQFELFRAQMYQARGQVLESERQLRGVLGLRSDDGTRLVPADEPNLAEFKPDFYQAANETMANRPELLLVREEVKAQQLNLQLQRNLRRPDLRFFALYDVAGLGTRLDGREFVDDNPALPGNAFVNFANNQFNSWTIGLRLDMPLGFRDANAQVRQATYQLTRYYYYLRDAELKALEFLIGRYRRVIETYVLIAPRRSRREQLTLYVERQQAVIEIGKWTQSDYFNLIQAERDKAQAIADEFRAIADYNSALAEFEFAKGTILQYNNVSLAEGPLPPWVSKRAADHERERSAAIKLRERPADCGPVEAVGGHTVGPAVGSPFISTMPKLTEMPPSPPDDLNLPDPKKTGEPLPEPKKLPNGNPAPLNAPTQLPPVTGLPVPSPSAPGDIGATNPGEYFKPEGTATIPPSRVRPNGFTPADPSRPTGTPAPTTGPTSPVMTPAPSAPAPSAPTPSAPIPSAPPVPLPAPGGSIPPTLPTIPTLPTGPGGR